MYIFTVFNVYYTLVGYITVNVLYIQLHIFIYKKTMYIMLYLSCVCFLVWGLSFAWHWPLGGSSLRPLACCHSLSSTSATTKGRGALDAVWFTRSSFTPPCMSYSNWPKPVLSYMRNGARRAASSLVGCCVYGANEQCASFQMICFQILLDCN